MKVALVPATLLLVLSGCASLESVTRHDLHSGYFMLKNDTPGPHRVYADVHEDSVTVYDLENDMPVMESAKGGSVSLIHRESFLYDKSLVKQSLDVDLATIAAKLRPAALNMPPQLNANINAAIYTGFRKDYFHFRSKRTVINRSVSSVRHIGYDAGVFAGIGITAMNPWVTNDHIAIEYDGVVFQKGAAFFFNMNGLSIGIACGFDNLLDHNSRNWVYNNKPYIGLMLGIANF